MIRLYFISILSILFLGNVSLQAQVLDLTSLHVDGICGMCETTIEETSLKISGVNKASWDVDSKYLTLKYDPALFDLQILSDSLNAAGYDTEFGKASDEAYDAVHFCCKYRDEEVILAHAPSIAEGKTPQAYLSGIILEDNKQEYVPLVGATIYWLGTTKGSTSNLNGDFTLPTGLDATKIVVSYLGYKNDTLEISGFDQLTIILSNSEYFLSEVTVKYERKSTEISMLDPIKTLDIGEKELCKAACCNLSESFETSPSVDVSSTDAVSGTRKIQMLGLAGPYVQITRENIPAIRGLSSIYGLTFIPGSWIEGIQLNQGAGSVVNGFESITGQINVELKKPDKKDKTFVNLFVNNNLRMEGNLIQNFKVSDKLSTGVSLHGNYLFNKWDRNDDGFLDTPLSQQFIGINRWTYKADNGIRLQVGVQGTAIDKKTGVYDFEQKSDIVEKQLWGSEVNTRRLDGWMKLGKVLKKPETSFGFQLAGSYHEQDAYFGMRTYNAEQQSVYSNFIFQSRIKNDKHKYKAGLSFQYDKINEDLILFSGDKNFKRTETVPGAFLEYIFSPSDRFTAVGGIRADYSNIQGLFYTPRLHLKYSPDDETAIRLAAGKGQRLATIFAENIGMFASNRNIVLQQTDSENPYGLNPEIAWNFGVNFTRNFSIKDKTWTLGLDYFYTFFDQQIVVDYENPTAVQFYNLDGESFSNSLQMQIDFEPIDRLDVRVAYRFNDVKTDMIDGRLDKALNSRNRAFINLAYETDNEWLFDFTANWQGKKRRTKSFNDNGTDDWRYSPNFTTFNAQISKIFGEKWDVYLGTENILNYRQDNPIQSAQNPFDEAFDASQIWGPVVGRNIYAGLRLRLN